MFGVEKGKNLWCGKGKYVWQKGLEKGMHVWFGKREKYLAWKKRKGTYNMWVSDISKKKFK